VWEKLGVYFVLKRFLWLPLGFKERLSQIKMGLIGCIIIIIITTIIIIIII
jgi:hypothetical protein